MLDIFLAQVFLLAMIWAVVGIAGLFCFADGMGSWPVALISVSAFIVCPYLVYIVIHFWS